MNTHTPHLAEPHHYDARDDFNSALLEAATAGWLCNHVRDGQDVHWIGGNNRAVDVTSGEHRIDAKTAFIEDCADRTGQVLPHLAFMSADREVEARPDVTHYMLGVPRSRSRVSISVTGEVSISPVSFTLYLIPSDDINTRFVRGYWKNEPGRVSKGKNRHLPVSDVEASGYRVLGPAPTEVTSALGLVDIDSIETR